MSSAGFGDVETWPALATPPRDRRCIATVTDSRAIRSFSAAARSVGATGASYRVPPSASHQVGGALFPSVKTPAYLIIE